MQKHTIAAIVILVLLIIGGAIYKAWQPGLQAQKAYATSDARDMKGEITIALDSWIGYFPLQSPVFKKLMRDEGYRILAVDDNADYPGRMANLQSGEVDLAVCTVDAYLVNGAAFDFPATIIAVIDESSGGDAILAWRDKLDSIDKLKAVESLTIAFTPDSPSHHLLKSIGVHFGIAELLDSSGSWRVETNGAEEAYQKLMRREVDMAVVWEPHVTAALANPDIVKLLGTEDVEKLIVDILLVNRDFARKNSALVELTIDNYFQTIEVYAEQPELFRQDIKAVTKLADDQIQSMLQGVRLLDFYENVRWFGLSPQPTYYQEELVSAIDSTAGILIEYGDFLDNPLPNSDPLTIVDSSFLGKVNSSGAFGTGTTAYENSLERSFAALTDSQWDQMHVVGALKLRNVTFQSGTANLDFNGQQQLDASVETLSHYPNFRIVVKGHTEARGDPEANQALSQERANAVRDYFVQTYRIGGNRIRAIGVGGSEPLARIDGESSRSYADRLKRVEVYMVSP